jgi:hypothetical protein
MKECKNCFGTGSIGRFDWYEKKWYYDERCIICSGTGQIDSENNKINFKKYILIFIIIVTIGLIIYLKYLR